MWNIAPCDYSVGHMAGLVGGLLVPVHGQQAERRLPVPPTTLRSSASLSLRRVSLFKVSFFETVFFMKMLSLVVRDEHFDSDERRRIVPRRICALRNKNVQTICLANDAFTNAVR